MSQYFDVAKITLRVNLSFDMFPAFTSANTEYFVRCYQDARQKSRGDNNSPEANELNQLISESIRKTRDLLIQSKGSITEKADALQEMLFLQTQGLKVDFLDFPISELMLSDDYSIKMMAYLAASQFWEPDAEVITMVISCLNKDLTGFDACRKSLALTLIPQIVTSSIAADLATNVILNFNTSRDDIRQKAITCFYKLCLKFPDCLVPGIKALNLKNLLSDPSTPTGTVQALLALLNELVVHNPYNYKSLLPTLVKFFQDSQGSPWILNRALSIVGTIASTLSPSDLEKFSEKITTMISEILNFAASPSVVFEVINLICKLKIKSKSLIISAADRAQGFIENEDPNLRYLGLISITRLIPAYQSIISYHKIVHTFTTCIDSDDQTCVFIALDLLSNLADNKNIGEIVNSLIDQIEKRPPGIVRDNLVKKLIEVCNYDNYSRFHDYQWYVNVLLTVHSFGVQSKELANEVLTMALRAKNTREYIVSELVEYLEDFLPGDTDFLATACFIVGEYAETNSKNMDFLLNEKFEMCDSEVQGSSINAAFKLYTRTKDQKDLIQNGEKLLNRLNYFAQSRYTDVIERSCIFRELVYLFNENQNIEGLNFLFSQTLHAVDPSAQLRVKIPSTLDIASPIVDLDPRESVVSFDDENDDMFSLPNSESSTNNRGLLLSPLITRDNKENNKEQKPKKIRRLTPLEQKNDDLTPVEGQNATQNLAQKVIDSPLSNISFSPGESGRELPVIKPYVQSDLMMKAQRNTLAVKKMQSLKIFKEIGECQGLAVDITDYNLVNDGLEFMMKCTNTSQIPISALEISLDNDQVSVFRNEIEGGFSNEYKVKYRTRELEEQKIVKISVIPTGGIGEVLRGKIRISPSLFLTKCEYDDIKDVCVVKKTIESSLTVSKIVDCAKECFHSSIIKMDVDGVKAVVIPAKSRSSSICIVAVIYKGDNGFVCDIRAPNENLAKLFETELKFSLDNLN